MRRRKRRETEPLALELVRSNGTVTVFPVKDGGLGLAALEVLHAWQYGDELIAQHAGYSVRVIPATPAYERPTIREIGQLTADDLTSPTTPKGLPGPFPSGC